jgi:hypothetical protein
MLYLLFNQRPHVYDFPFQVEEFFIYSFHIHSDNTKTYTIIIFKNLNEYEKNR